MTQQESKPAESFAETAVGAVVLLSIMFVSLPLLAGGLALIGIAKLVSHWRTRTA
jgi:hypothetical protein